MKEIPKVVQRLSREQMSAAGCGAAVQKLVQKHKVIPSMKGDLSPKT